MMRTGTATRKISMTPMTSSPNSDAMRRLLPRDPTGPTMKARTYDERSMFALMGHLVIVPHPYYIILSAKVNTPIAEFFTKRSIYDEGWERLRQEVRISYQPAAAPDLLPRYSPSSGCRHRSGIWLPAGSRWAAAILSWHRSLTSWAIHGIIYRSTSPAMEERNPARGGACD